jgi:hypothetical protein
MGRNAAYFVVIFCASVAGLSFGLGYGSGNDIQYTIGGIRLYDATFLENDWFATQTTQYHKNFSYVVYLLSLFGSRPLNLAIMNAVLIVAGFLFVFRSMKLCSPREALTCFVLLMCLVMLFGTKDVAQSYLFVNVLQPSSVGAAALLGAVSFFVTGQFLLSSLFLAVSGWFHINFLIAGVFLFGLAHILLKEGWVIGRVLKQTSLSIIVAAIAAKTMFGMVKSDNADLARYIFQNIRAPGHYVPWTFLNEFLPFVGWNLFGLMCIPFARMEKPYSSRLISAYLSSLIIVVAASCMTTVVFVPFISQLYFWRLAPVATLLGQILIVTVVVQKLAYVRGGGKWGEFATFRVLLGLCGLGLVVFGSYGSGTLIGRRLGEYWRNISLVCFLGLCVSMLTMYWVKRGSRTLEGFGRTVLFVSICVFACISLLVIRPAYWRSTAIKGLDMKAETELFDWAQTTPKDGLFLIPPGLAYFRFHAARAVVVDWFAAPMVPEEVIEWYRRLSIVAGRDVGSLKEAEEGYQIMSAERLKNIREEFGIDFAVFRRAKTNVERFGNVEVVFSNDQLVVVKLIE